MQADPHRPRAGGKDHGVRAEAGGFDLPTSVHVMHRSFRRTRPLVAAATLLTAAALSSGSTAHAFGYTHNCPKAGTYVSKATWHRHTLMNGVVLSEGQAKDAYGTVSMHVLTVNMTNTNIAFHPLMRHIAQRSPLSSLAGGHSHLVAATNTGYFDFGIGAPLGPLVNARHPITGTAAGSSFVGVSSTHRVYTGKLHLAATITINGVTKVLKGYNSFKVPSGYSLYTPKWGSEPIQLPWGGVARYLTNGVISSGTGRYTTPPTSGHSMLVARGTTAVAWLKSLPRGATLKQQVGYTTDAPATITQAYQVGAEIVQQPGVARTDLSCRKAYPMPARNAVGWNNNHKRLIIAVVTDKPGTSVHGLDGNQMSKLMVELGAARAYLWDGSGSAEMIGRMPSTGRLSIRNYPSDGQERTMPVGFGIFKRR
jgi:hypothetical protein